MCVTAIPLLILLFLQYQNNQNLLSALSTYEEAHQRYTDAKVYLISDTIAAGEAITSDILTPCMLKIPKDTSVHFVNHDSQLIGTYAKTELSKGSILTKDMLLKDNDFLIQSRRIELTDLRLPTALSLSDLLEIRISFPNGEDYVILKHKKIHEFLKEEDLIYGITLTLSEEELLRLSSARVDATRYEGACLYAVIYQADYEIAATVDYPVNADVFSLMLWDPNVLAHSITQDEIERRNLLEERLHRFAQLKAEDFSSAIVVEQNYNMSQP